MSKKPRTYMTHPKERQEGDEVITNKPITIDIPLPQIKPEPTQSKITQDPEKTGRLPQRTDQGIIRQGEAVAVSPLADLPQMARRPPDYTKETMPRIYGETVEATDIREPVNTEVTRGAIRNHRTLGESRTSLREWGEGYAKPEGKPVIRQQDVRFTAQEVIETTPTRGGMVNLGNERRDSILRDIKRTLEEKKEDG